MGTFEPITDFPIIASSYSASETYATCPRKYYEEKIAKNIPFEETEHTRYGKYVHKCFEDAVAHGVPLPKELDHHTNVVKWIESFRGKGGTIMCEQRFGLSDKYEPCSFFSKKQTVMWRAILDVLVIHGDVAIILDYKTGGKVRRDFTQLRQAAAMIMIKYPQVKEAVLAFYYTKHSEVVKSTMSRGDLAMEVNKIRGMAYRIAKAANNDFWPTTPNGLCGWCAVKDCEFNEG